jgi:hypothetical protein
MNLFQGTSFRPLTVAIAATFSLVLVASTAHASGNVQWGVSVEVPVPATAVYPVYTPAPVAVQLPPPPHLLYLLHQNYLTLNTCKRNSKLVFSGELKWV